MLGKHRSASWLYSKPFEVDRGPFVDVGAGGGAGAVAGADYFGGWADDQLVQGATVSVSAGLRGSASTQITNTYVFPLSTGTCR